MTERNQENLTAALTLENDRKNIATLENARISGKINDEAAEYLKFLYSDSLYWFREVFYILGKCFGAPKTAVMKYDYAKDCAVEEPISIADINPLNAYIVQHRLDGDPMRNQFFASSAGHKIDLAVSSIVTVIVGAQKTVSRALDKIVGKYYESYVNEVSETVYNVIAAHEREASAKAIAEKIRNKLKEKYISTPAEAVLSIIGSGHEKIAANLVRALDKIEKPRMRLQDVWRVKCLFDLIPQARTFMERIQSMMPDRILSVRDCFYNMQNPRNYRDAKIIINIGPNKDTVIPMEIICQVRTFFDFEKRTHLAYEEARKKKSAKSDNIEAKLALFMEDGIKSYNRMVCKCLDDLFDRVGWNILYSQGNMVSMLDGFPKECKLYHPQKILDNIIEKLDDAIENELFHITNAPTKLSKIQQSNIFHFLARFILVSAMPYMQTDWAIDEDTQSARFFNFVMREIQRYYKK